MIQVIQVIKVTEGMLETMLSLSILVCMGRMR